MSLGLFDMGNEAKTTKPQPEYIAFWILLYLPPFSLIRSHLLYMKKLSFPFFITSILFHLGYTPNPNKPLKYDSNIPLSQCIYWCSTQPCHALFPHIMLKWRNYNHNSLTMSNTIFSYVFFIYPGLK